MITEKLDEALELMNKHWGHGEAPYNEEMLTVIRILEECKNESNESTNDNSYLLSDDELKRTELRA